MSKTLQRPLACRNAHCGAFCSPADASFCGGNPSRCDNYERRDDLYRKTEILDKVKEAKKEIMDNSETLVIYGEDDTTQKYYEVMEVSRILEILDKIIEEREA